MRGWGRGARPGPSVTTFSPRPCSIDRLHVLCLLLGATVHEPTCPTRTHHHPDSFPAQKLSCFIPFSCRPAGRTRAAANDWHVPETRRDEKRKDRRSKNGRAAAAAGLFTISRGTAAAAWLLLACMAWHPCRAVPRALSRRVGTPARRRRKRGPTFCAILPTDSALSDSSQLGRRKSCCSLFETVTPLQESVASQP